MAASSGGLVNKNIKRMDGVKCYLSLLRKDEEAVQKYMAWMSDEATSVNIEMNHEMIDVSEMPGWLNDGHVRRMGIVRKDTDEMVGYCHCKYIECSNMAWLSINIGEHSARGQGIGTEVIGLLLKYAFMELHCHSVALDVLETNYAGIACYSKCGFKVSGRYRHSCFHGGEYCDWLHMDILEEEYRGKIG